MSRLPTVDLETLIQRRTDGGKKAVERRLQREQDLAERAAKWLGEGTETRTFRNQHTIVCPLDRAHAFLAQLRNAFGFDMLADVTAVDYLKHPGDHPERFAVIWNLTNLNQEARLRVMSYVDEDNPIAPTASDLWEAANWAEREVWDMYGIEFSGHPNLIRLLMPAEYSGFPLRKDYPLRGRGERDNFPVIRRGEGEELA